MENNTERIDQYLLDQMNAEDKAEFEKELASNPELQKELNLQKDILKGIEVSGIKSEFSKAFKQRVMMNKAIMFGGIVILAAVICGLGYVWVNNSDSNSIVGKENIVGLDSTSKTERGKQTFEINNTRDTIIETKGGMVIAIEQGSFDSKGTSVSLSIQEAFTPEDIILNGLSTMSDGKLLETAGMFTIDAFENNEKVSMLKNLLARVPTDSIDKDIMLFKGEKDINGIINWVEPQAIQKVLQTVDINTLDFYPTRYLSTLKELGLNYKNKKYTDSLYYSFSGYQRPQVNTIQPKGDYNFIKHVFGNYSTTSSNGGKIEAYNMRTENPEDRKKHYFFNSKSDLKRFEDSVLDVWSKRDREKRNSDSISQLDGNMEFDPSRIRAIWNSKFNNTIIATKEFEERLKFIHSTCEPKFLKCYVSNLRLKLYQIDSICASFANGSNKAKFIEFYKRKDGGINISDKLQHKLNKYFEKTYQAYKIAVEKSWMDFLQKEQKNQADQDEILMENYKKDLIREGNVLNEEYCLNLVDAYKQLGENKECPIQTPAPAPNYYEVRVSTGSYNLDKYVSDATISRTSLEYVSETGKKAIITYTPLEVTVEGFQNYDRVMVYLLPKSLSSFQRLSMKANGVFTEKLNSLIQYDLVAIGFKGNSTFIVKRAGINAVKLSISLSQIQESEIASLLSSYKFGASNDIIADVKYKKFEQESFNRAVKKLKIQEQTDKIVRAIFPCSFNSNVSELMDAPARKAFVPSK